MPFIPPGYANLQFLFINQEGNQKALTAIGLELAAADPATVLTQAEAAISADLMDECTNNWLGEDIRLVVGTSDPSAPLTYSYGSWVGGTNSGEPLPSNCSWLLKKATNTGGRKGRGRMFVPGPNESGVDGGGAISPSQLTLMNTIAGDFLDALRDIDGVSDVVLLHEDEDDTPSTIISMACDPLIATQRRRMRR